MDSSRLGQSVLTSLGIIAACGLAAKSAYLLWHRCSLGVGPAHVRKYKWRWAVVTGGSEGLGKAIASSLAARGLNVILVSRSQVKLDAAQKELQAKCPNVQVRTVPCDLSKAAQCQQLVQALEGQDIACLVANAGGGVRGPTLYWEYSAAEESAVYDLNGLSCYALVRGLLPGMLARGSGAIVGISSLAHKLPALMVPYGAEKAKMNAFMEGLDAELRMAGMKGITAQAMVIGGVITPAIVKYLQPGLRNAPPADMAAAVAAAEAQRGWGLMSAPAAAVAEAVVRAIGKGGPVVTPYWRHAIVEAVQLDMWWPPALARAVKRRCTRSWLAGFDPKGWQAAAKPATG